MPDTAAFIQHEVSFYEKTASAFEDKRLVSEEPLKNKKLASVQWLLTRDIKRTQIALSSPLGF